MTNRAIRYVTAAVAAAVAVVYFLIALGAITVVSTTPQQGDALIPAAAGVAFAILAILLAVTKSRLLLAIGLGMSIFTILGYFVVAPHRTPSFETWGVVIKVAQAFLAVALGYLVFRPDVREPAEGHMPRLPG